MAKSAFTINFEYWLLRFAAALVNVLPHALALALARAAAWVFFHVFRYRRRRTLNRIRSVFPEKSAREARAIAVRSLANLFANAVEMMRAPTLTREWMDTHVEGGEHYRDVLQALVDEGHGLVIMVPHSGNWYMPAWALAKYGLRLFAIAARQRNPKIEAWMNRQYGEVEVLDRDDRTTLVRIVRKLKEGGVFAILPDLRVWDEDVDAEFLGGHANVSRAGAAFAVNCGSPIVVAAMRRSGSRHVINYLATLRPNPNAPDRRDEAERLTKEVLRLLDGAIRERPGEWFWYNKRWILEPIRDEDRRGAQS